MVSVGVWENGAIPTTAKKEWAYLFLLFPCTVETNMLVSIFAKKAKFRGIVYN